MELQYVILTSMTPISQKKKRDIHPIISHRCSQLPSMPMQMEKTFYWHWRLPIKCSAVSRILHQCENTGLIIPFRAHTVRQPGWHVPWDSTAVKKPTRWQLQAPAIILSE